MTIIDYSYPHLVDRGGLRVCDDLEANWLDVVVSGTDGPRRWRVPFRTCLLNWEALRLAQWIEGVAAGRQPRRGFSPTFEMAPALRVIEDGKRLEIRLQSGRSPLIFPVDPGSLWRFAAELKHELAPFPLRALETNGDAHRQRLVFTALNGVPMTALSICLPRTHLGQVERLSLDLRMIVNSLGGATIEGFHWIYPAPQPSDMRAIFAESFDALDAALSCSALARRAGIPLQIGVHYGIVAREMDDEIGGAMTVASEIGRMCEPGHIVASEAACELAGEHAGLGFDDLGVVHVAGGPASVHLFDVTSRT